MMNGVNFFGTTVFPGQPCSNKKFNRTVQIALIIVLALGVTLSALGASGILPYNFIFIGSAIAAAAFIALVAYKCLQKNWLLEALKKAMQDNNPDNFQAIIDQCASEVVSPWWDCCDGRGPVMRISSQELVGTPQDAEISTPINDFVRLNLNSSQNADRWDEVFNNLIQLNGNEQFAPDIRTFANQRQVN